MGAILRVGLTGNIGAGKSTVGAMLEDAGCLLIDADLLAHDLLAPGTEANEQVVALFGDGVRATGQMDRHGDRRAQVHRRLENNVIG